MSTVRQRAHELLSRHGVEYVFGNPGSNELPFLTELPAGMQYVLALHEGVAVGIADGYAQATGRPAVVNLHAASGTGNAMGAIANAAASHTPLVVIAGQQVRETLGLEPLLTNVDAPALVRPLVKWSGEPASAADVPRSVSQALWEATLESPGPVCLSVPYDDWSQPSRDNDELLPSRYVRRAGALAANDLRDLVRRLEEAERVAVVLGSDVDAAGANDDARTLAERLDADVWFAPSMWRLPMPNRHGQVQGVLPASARLIGECLSDYDMVLVVGAPVFRYHQHDPGPFLAADVDLVHLTRDAAEATRAPMGTSFVVDLAEALGQLADTVPARPNERYDTWRPVPETAPATDGEFRPARLFSLMRDTLPADTAYVVESTSTTGAFWEQMDLRDPSSFFWPAAGGLGFGLAAAVGVKLGVPDRPVVAVVGDGSANYAITALWVAAQYRVPVVFVILKNGTYGALRWFADVLGIPDAPGLDIAGLDFCALARGYGVPAEAVASEAELLDAMEKAVAADHPTLIEVETVQTSPGETA